MRFGMEMVSKLKFNDVSALSFKQLSILLNVFSQIKVELKLLSK